MHNLIADRTQNELLSVGDDGYIMRERLGTRWLKLLGSTGFAPAISPGISFSTNTNFMSLLKRKPSSWSSTET